MRTILDKILEHKKGEIKERKRRLSLKALQEQVAEQQYRCRDFYRALTKRRTEGINVIAELKKASPSAGVIREDFDVTELAQTYETAGADAISVLTDEHFFQGSLSYLHQVKQVVALPVLRKDFIIDPYQIYEARAAGADAILLIAEALEPTELADMTRLANSLTLTVLVEIHEIESLTQIRSEMGLPQEHGNLLGINNRNLKTMQVDLENSIKIIDCLGKTDGLISESGIRKKADVQKLIQAGFSGVLIGETLMDSGDVGAKFAELFR